MQSTIVKITSTIVVLLLLFNFLVIHVETVKSINQNPNLKKSNDVTLPPCAACKLLIESFKKGFERTKRGKFEGGDSAWEEDKNAKYKKSEVRLVEIQEKLCDEVKNSQSQCHSLAEEFESFIEDWWFHHQETYPDIFDFICIEKARRCCPKHHFGVNCQPCPGHPDNICNNNGKCKGDGTRKGNGACLCDKGYAGEDCFECTPDHYEAYRDEKKLLCSPCHAACNATCDGPGTRDCDACAQGWKQMVSNEGKGCYDINECALSHNVCSEKQFCVNTEGSYHCLGCDKACEQCTGDGPDMCITCAENYIKKDGICVNAETVNNKQKENLARYLTYFGFGVTTCIIFQRNVYVAAIIGLFVGAYIALSEYTIHNNSQLDLGPNVHFVDSST